MTASLPVDGFIHDASGRLTSVSGTLSRRLGYSAKELEGRCLSFLEIDTDDTRWHAAGTPPPAAELCRWRRSDGAAIMVELIRSALAGDPGDAAAAGGARHYLVLVRDGSATEDRLMMLEQMVGRLSSHHRKALATLEAHNGFLRTVAGRLRPPLASLQGQVPLVETALRDLSGHNDRSDNALRALSDIDRHARDMMQVTDEIVRAATFEAALTPGDGSFRQLIEMSPDAIFLCRNGVVAAFNSMGLRLLGRPAADQIEGAPLSQFIHPDYRVLSEENFAPLVGEPGPAPMKFLDPEGKAIDVAVTATTAPDDDGSVLLVVRNISEVMRAHRDVARQVKRLNSILDTAVDAIVVTDESGRIETFNNSAESMFQYPASQAIGAPIEMLMAPESAREHQRKVAEALSARHAQLADAATEIDARRQDGSLFPAEISLSLCHLDDRRLFTAIFRDVTERRNFEDYLAHSANHDSLTGLPNRRLLQERLQQAIDHAANGNANVAIWFVDLDGFKMVNDVMGHAAGDELLVEAGRRMVSIVDPADMVARFGGDEFAIVTRNAGDRNGIEERVQRFVEAMTRPFSLRGRELTLMANVGIALFPDHASQATELIVHASAAMMFAKARGRNQYRFFDPVMHSQSEERLTLENELRRGIERNELLLHYQPQIEATTGRILGLEALVRWQHPTMGLVQPGRFIPIAEQTGLIVPLGEWVVHQACDDIRKLEDMGFSGISIGVNISARQFSDSDVLGLIEEAIGRTGIDPVHLDVEITESTLMNDPEHVIGYLERMKALGVSLSIDDFGTGYSSFNYLKSFPVDTLKIDRSFITDIADNPKDEAIAVTIVTLAHRLGMTVLAEGVEHSRQAEILARHGCDAIQGYLYSRPVPLAEAVAALNRGGHLRARHPDPRHAPASAGITNAGASSGPAGSSLYS
ncbi:MAG: EAL domain-containing protein [Telmatospirillum sp.]|nr:EAL domain-containing protein [Telmatospirillum sp.]